MSDATREELAARIAAIEAGGSGRTTAPESPPVPGERPADPPPAPERGRARPAPAAQPAFTGAEPHQRAIELAYKLVTQRERTVRQLREKLAAKECAPVAIDAAVAELTRYGFVDDRRYAKLFAEDKRRLQGWGSRRIRLELARAGVARELLDELFADGEAQLDAPSELEVAVDLLRRKRPDLADPKVKQRMAAMLARRGIAPPVVFGALRAYAAETEGSDR